MYIINYNTHTGSGVLGLLAGAPQGFLILLDASELELDTGGVLGAEKKYILDI